MNDALGALSKVLSFYSTTQYLNVLQMPIRLFEYLVERITAHEVNQNLFCRMFSTTYNNMFELSDRNQVFTIVFRKSSARNRSRAEEPLYAR